MVKTIKRAGFLLHFTGVVAGFAQHHGLRVVVGYHGWHIQMRATCKYLASNTSYDAFVAAVTRTRHFFTTRFWFATAFVSLQFVA